MTTTPDKTTAYFDTLAAQYAAHRPGYPAAAIDWIVEGLSAGAVAADIGCGTGISTRALATRGFKVIGVDPSEPMLATARQSSAGGPNAPEFRVGTGEQTGLEDGTVDLVMCAQAFHWLDPPAALAEFCRVLKTRGRLALMWNRRDGGATAFDAVLEDITNRSQDDAASRGLKVVRHRSFTFDAFGDLFANVEMREFDNPQWMTIDQLLGRFHSASYFPPEGSALRDQFEREIRAAFDAVEEDGIAKMAQATSITRATRAG